MPNGRSNVERGILYNAASRTTVLSGEKVQAGSHRRHMAFNSWVRATLSGSLTVPANLASLSDVTVVRFGLPP